MTTHEEFEPWCGSCGGDGMEIEPSGAVRNQSFVPYKRSDLKSAGAGDGFVFVRHASDTRKPAHTDQALISAIEESMSIFRRRWGFVPKKLVVVIKEMKPMGTAKSTSASSDHVMSLSAQLISDYGIKSIKRTILHELSHFYRASISHYKAIRPRHGHDDKFCDILGAVDPVVASNKGQCRFFRDDVDDGAVSKQQKLRRGATIHLAAKSRGLYGTLTDGDGKVIEKSFPINTASLRKMLLLSGGDSTLITVISSSEVAAWNCFPSTRMTLRAAIAALASACRRKKAPSYAQQLLELLSEFSSKSMQRTGRSHTKNTARKPKDKPKSKPAKKAATKAKPWARSSRR